MHRQSNYKKLNFHGNRTNISRVPPHLTVFVQSPESIYHTPEVPIEIDLLIFYENWKKTYRIIMKMFDLILLDPAAHNSAEHRLLDRKSPGGTSGLRAWSELKIDNFQNQPNSTFSTQSRKLKTKRE